MALARGDDNAQNWTFGTPGFIRCPTGAAR
jgi:hypothetical protein